jgi:uracil phosphoribosyltransferase
MRLLAEECLARVDSVVPNTVTTPCGECAGLSLPAVDRMCAVSIVRSGDILLEALRQIVPGVAVGKILLQRDETGKHAEEQCSVL